LDQRHYAIKAFSKEQFDHPEYEKYVSREIEILPKIRHPNIIKYEGIFEDEKKICVVSQVGWVGSLRNFLIRYQKPISIELLIFWTIEILNALKYFEESNIVHRDLKPENILLDENFHIKI
jgi:serine/threonine protein kinase